jgi:PAS domain S-box-containing protein
VTATLRNSFNEGIEVKIRHKLFAGLLGVPVIFAGVAIFLIITNRQVQRDARQVAAHELKLGNLAAQLPAAFITGQSAAHQLLAEKRRARLEPAERNSAEQGARDAKETIKENSARTDKILDSLTEITQASIKDARKMGAETNALSEGEELEAIEKIRDELRRYDQCLEKYLAAIDVNSDNADELLNIDVKQEYEDRLAPLVLSYATDRFQEITKKTAEIEQSIDRISRLVASSAIGTLLFAIMVALFLSHSISYPLRKLTAAAAQIGKGRLGSRIQIKSRDEIGLLARAFNQMTDDLGRTTVSKDYVDGIIKSMGDSLVVASPAGLILTVNAATCRMLGYSETELIGQPLHMLFANDKSLSCESHEGDVVSNMECAYLAKDGRGIPVAFSRTSMRLDAGGAPAIVCVATDITELKAAAGKMLKEISDRTRVEEELRLQKILLESQSEASLDGVLVISAEGKIISLNQRFIDIWGIAGDVLATKSGAAALEAMADNVDQPGEFLNLADYDRQHLDERSEKDITLKDGRILHYYAAPVKSSDDVYYGRACYFRDITERKGLENKLLQAQKLESVGQLAAGISHEINTPTQYVGDNTRFLQDAFQDLLKVQQKYLQLVEACHSGTATADLLAEVEASAKEADVDYLIQEIPKALNQALEGTERISKIVQSMKDFAHPGASVMQPCDLNKAIESTITVACGEWKYVADMVRDFDLTLPLVPCLRGEFNQVVLNMIINASHAIGDAMGEGSARKGTITISTRCAGAWAEIRIGDTGTGIPEASRARVFDPFFTTKRVGKGTGQGLAISHTVVEKHGGTITFETAEGEGTTFIIRLPLQETAKMPDGLKEAA